MIYILYLLDDKASELINIKTINIKVNVIFNYVTHFTTYLGAQTNNWIVHPHPRTFPEMFW